MCDPQFHAWCEVRGVRTKGVAPALVAEGWRGVVATERLEADTVVMSVPEALLMSVLSARRDPQLSGVLGQHQQLSSHQVLAVHLLHEASKGRESPWAPYLQQLPRHFPTLMAWPAEAAQALQARYAVAAAAAAADRARGEWAAARPALASLGLAAKWRSWPAWRWAASCVLSRTMFHPADPPCGCLTPLGDLHNYAPPPAPFAPDVKGAARRLAAAAAAAAQEGSGGGQRPHQEEQGQGQQGQQGQQGEQGEQQQQEEEEPQLLCGDGYFDEGAREYRIVARRSYSAGEQVFLCYGRHSNLDLLELYGFLLPRNPHEVALLDPGLLRATLRLERQRRAAEQQGGRPWRRQAQQQQQWRQRRSVQQEGEDAGGGADEAPEQDGTQLDVCAADCCVHVGGQPSWQLLKALRLAAATREEARAAGHLAMAGDPISAGSERAALRCLSAACRLQLGRLPTTLGQDEALLEELEAAGTKEGSGVEAAAPLSTAELLGSGAERPRACAGGTISSCATGRSQDMPLREQEQHQGRQQRRQEQERQQDCACMVLAVAWRACHKRALMRCSEQCERALTLLEGGG